MYADSAILQNNPTSNIPDKHFISLYSDAGSLIAPKSQSKIKFPLSVTTGPALSVGVAIRSFIEAAGNIRLSEYVMDDKAIGITSIGTPRFH
jgi:hypothetical protein